MRKKKNVGLGEIVIVKDSDKSSAKLSGFGEIIIVKDVDKSTSKFSETGKVSDGHTVRPSLVRTGRLRT